MSWSYALDSWLVLHTASPRFMCADLFKNVRRALPANGTGGLMPVDVSEPHGQSRSALFCSGDRRVLLVTVPLVFRSRCEATGRVVRKQHVVVLAVNDVLTDLA